MEEKIRNLTFIVILGFIIMFILIIGLYFKGGNSDTTTNDNNNNNSSSSSENNSSSTYDVSAMNEVDVDEAVALFESDDVEVLYIGRSNCSVCVSYVPVLNQVQEDLGFTSNYLNAGTFMTTNWETQKEELEPLIELLTMETTVNTTMNGESVTLEDTVGNLFYDYGFTPITVIIKDGKMVDGFIGYRNADTLTELIEPHL